MTTEQELDLYMRGRTKEERAAIYDIEAAVRWLCKRIELKAQMPGQVPS